MSRYCPDRADLYGFSPSNQGDWTPLLEEDFSNATTTETANWAVTDGTAGLNDNGDYSVFNNDPVLPPNGYGGRSWNFFPKVHIQDNIGSLSKSGNIFLTNIQRFVTRNEVNKKNSSMDFFLGDKPVVKTTDNKILVICNFSTVIYDSENNISKTITGSENINSELLSRILNAIESEQDETQVRSAGI